MADEKLPQYIMVSYGTVSENEAVPTLEKLPQSVKDAPVDCDGVIIPWPWSERPLTFWEKLPIATRQAWSRIWIMKEEHKKGLEEVAEKKAKEKAAKGQKPAGPRAPSTSFTTQYAVDYGLKQPRVSGVGNWRLIDRERYERNWSGDMSRGRHHDLMFGTDVLFDDGGPGMIAIQAAGVNEREKHYQRFLDRGGPSVARRRRIKVYYWVFERGKKEPVEIERWA